MEIPDATSETGNRRVPVTTGISNGSKTEIVKGLVRRPAGDSPVAAWTRPGRMTYFRELFGQVLSSLLRNKLRSFLTMAGIAWGVASMVLIVAMGDGFKIGQRDRFREIGENIVVVFNGRTEKQAGGRRAGRRIRLTYDDVRDIRTECFLVARVVAELQNPASAVTPFNSGTFSVMGVEPLYSEIRNIPVDRGRFLMEADGAEAARVAILGDNVRQQLFGSHPVAPGGTVAINGLPFRIVGLMPPKTQNSGYNGLDSDKIFIPYSTMVRDLPLADDELPSGNCQRSDLCSGVARRLEGGARPGAAGHRAQPSLPSRRPQRHLHLGHRGERPARRSDLYLDDHFPGRHRGGDAQPGRRRGDEYHAGLGDREDAGDRPAQSRGRHARPDPGGLPSGGHPAGGSQRIGRLAGCIRGRGRRKPAPQAGNVRRASGERYHYRPGVRRLEHHSGRVRAMAGLARGQADAGGGAEL